MPDAKKILVIDDDKTVHLILKAAIEKEGPFKVYAALDAMQGMMTAKQLKPDLIILDIMMPAGGGFAVYERLQMISATFEVPFLIYSSMPAHEIEKKIKPGLQVEIFSKTARLEEIVAAVKRLTGS